MPVMASDCESASYIAVPVLKSHILTRPSSSPEMNVVSFKNLHL